MPLSFARQSLPCFLSIDRSNIQGAGLGIFADKDLKKEYPYAFGPYVGIKVDDVSAEEMKLDYAWKITKPDGTYFYVDGKDEKNANWMRFMNSARSEAEQSLVAFQYNGHIYYRLYKDVPAGTELLVWYGEDYGMELAFSADISPELVNQEKKLNPFKCRYCLYRTENNGHLQYHMRTHTGEKPYACHVCDKQFSVNSSLTNHMRVHTAEKPYACEICGYRFALSSSLTRHMRVHTGEKPYACEICAYRSAHSFNLKTHIKNNHPVQNTDMKC